jgi:hypothetical protein
MTLDKEIATPLVKVCCRTAKSFASDALAWEYAAFDTHGMWDPSDPKKVFIPMDGIYELICTVFQNGTVVSFDPLISRNFIGVPPNGVADIPDRVIGYAYVPRMNSAAYSNIHVCTVHPLKAGDYVAVSSQRANMGCAGTGSSTSNANTYFIVRWLDRLG